MKLAVALFVASLVAGSPMKIRSPRFEDHGGIPTVYTCEGPGRVPPLAWSDVPAKARSLALVIDDPDAPDPAAPRMTWVHWVLYDISPSAHGIPEGATAHTLPKGSREGLNSWKKAAYGGPCPPIGRHRYFFKLYALDTALPDLHHPTEAELDKAMAGHVLARAELVGTYQKHGG